MLPGVIDPMMPSKWSSFCARCQILVQASVEKMRWLDRQTKRRIGGLLVVKNP